MKGGMATQDAKTPSRASSVLRLIYRSFRASIGALGVVAALLRAVDVDAPPGGAVRVALARHRIALLRPLRRGACDAGRAQRERENPHDLGHGDAGYGAAGLRVHGAFVRAGDAVGAGGFVTAGRLL